MSFIQEINNKVLSPDCTAEKYGDAVMQLEGLLAGLEDEEYQTKKKELLKKYEDELMSAQLTKNPIKQEYAQKKYFFALFYALNKLADRKGLGWEKVGIADFDLYHDIVRKRKGINENKHMLCGAFAHSAMYS